MGIFQAHRRRAQSAWKHLHKTIYRKRNIWFSSCSHLHGCLRALVHKRLHFCSPPSQIIFTVLCLLSWFLAEPSPVQLLQCMPNSSLPWTKFASDIKKRRYNLNSLNTEWKLSLLSWECAKHAWFCWEAGNTMPVTFCWVWVKMQGGISIKYNRNWDFVAMNKEVIAVGNNL